MAATTTMTQTVPGLTNRPRRSSSKSVSKHLNLWRDIDAPSESPLPTASSGDPSFFASLIWRYLPFPVQQRLENMSANTYDLLTATFFSALAMVVLSIFFIGPHLGFIVTILGTYAAAFGIFLAAMEVVSLVESEQDRGTANVSGEEGVPNSS